MAVFLLYMALVNFDKKFENIDMATKKNKKAEEAVENEEVVNEEMQDQPTADAEEAIEQEVTEQQEVEEKDELTLAQEKAVEMTDKHLRLQAEFDNYRKRTLKEKMDLTKTAGEKLIKDILPVMDDFERAMETIDKAEDIEAVKEGLGLIYSKFEGFLKQNGVAAISTEDGVFDTEVHEAITQIPAPDEALKGKIIDCVQKGYTLNEKVIRHSKVVVGA